MEAMNGLSLSFHQLVERVVKIEMHAETVVLLSSQSL